MGRPQTQWSKLKLRKDQYKKIHKKGYYAGKMGAPITANSEQRENTMLAWEEGYREGLIDRENARAAKRESKEDSRQQRVSTTTE